DVARRQDKQKGGEVSQHRYKGSAPSGDAERRASFSNDQPFDSSVALRLAEYRCAIAQGRS
ncbi:MAG TPA: hypothetical protein VKG92_02860, partial [Flavobacteriales bacterium]|nr:hypothetical protein [Flavobacteriales bacterium]